MSQTINKRITKLERSVPDEAASVTCIDVRIIGADGSWDGIIHRKHLNGQPPQEIGPNNPEWYSNDKH